MAKELDGVRYNKTPVKYTKRIAVQIHKLYLLGHSITKIAEIEGYPTRDTIFRWKKEHSWFGILMAEAKTQRAELFEEKAIAAAEASVDKDDAPSQRLKFDAYKWGAEVNDPSKYGKKVTHAGDADAPIRFVVSTGFPEPNEHQRHPELGSDGLIKKKSVDKSICEEDAS